MKKIWARKDDAVSPVIATILMVAITVVLAAVLYVMVLGFGGGSSTPVATYSKATIANGQQINILSLTKNDIGWTDVKIQLTDGTNFAEWSPVTADLTSTGAVSKTLTNDTLGTGGLEVQCIVFDVSGNGYVSGSDYFKLTATSFAAGTSYTAVLIYEPTGEKIGNGISFTG